MCPGSTKEDSDSDSEKSFETWQEILDDLEQLGPNEAWEMDRRARKAAKKKEKKERRQQHAEGTLGVKSSAPSAY